MKCKNCGARLNDKSRVCPNCGASRDGSYVLLTEEKPRNDIYSSDEYDDYVDISSKPTKTKKKNNGKIAIVIILLIAILGAGGYFAYKYFVPKDKPDLSFTSGYGIINGDEPVIFVNIKENAQLEFIQGVNLYPADSTTNTQKLDDEYEYTKNIDGTFRTIFFDASKFDIKKGEEYTYTFEMMFSFVGSNEIYTYEQSVKFPGEITQNASDYVFDHSLQNTDAAEDESTTETVETTTSATTEATTTSLSTDFIKTGFWYTKPITNGESRVISAIQFGNNGACTITHYDKQGNNAWTTTNTNGKYEIKDNSVYVTDSQGLVESYAIKSNSLDGLTARKYNSTDNADDFFNL